MILTSTKLDWPLHMTEDGQVFVMAYPCNLYLLYETKPLVRNETFSMKRDL